MHIKIKMQDRVVSLIQTGAGNIFQFCVYLREKQYRRSLRTSDLQEAKARAKQYLSHILAQHQKVKYSGRRIRVSDYQKLLKEQNFACAICEVPFDLQRERSYCADHDHETGRDRGLLCTQCNFMLGHAKDEPDILAKGAHYLRNHTFVETSKPRWQRKPKQLLLGLNHTLNP